MLRLTANRFLLGSPVVAHARQRIIYTPGATTWARSSLSSQQRLLHSSSSHYLDTDRSHARSDSSNLPPPPNSAQQTSRRRTPSQVGTASPSRTSPSEAKVSDESATASRQSPSPSPLAPPPTTARLPRKQITSVAELPSRFGKNQIIAVPDAVRRDLEDVVSSFKAPVRFAFAYGSGVFRQKGYTNEDKPLLDFVFAVSHPSHWHAVNMQQNPSHYSLPMRLLGSDAVAWFQEKGLGAGVWFNVEVEVNGKTIKYGTISVDALCQDMLDWETLYISGRTQKPVRILVDDARVRLANQVNLASALRTALLLLPESFTEVELFETIAGLSYRGDFRMAVGENPLKVRNIVDAQLDPFRSLYGGLLKSFWKSVHIIGETPEVSSTVAGREPRSIRTIRQDTSARQRADTASKLPVGVRTKLLGHYERKWNLARAQAAAASASAGQKSAEAEEVSAAEAQEAAMDQRRLWERIVTDEEFQAILSKSIGQIVARPTFSQSLKGILSAGPLKSLRYIGPKLRKKWLAAKSPQAKAIEASATPSPPSDNKS